MAEQVLSVRLRAVVDGYQKSMDAAGRSTEQMASRAERITAIGDRATETGGKLTRGLTLPIAAVGTAALLTAGNFEAGMREVQALTSGTASEMEMLQGQAMKMGADTQFSATQAADAMSQLVKGGFDVRETYAALPGVMQLAAAASIDIASAADIATNVLSGFGLEVADLAQVNDYLAQTANASDTDVRELGEAFKYVGPVAKGAGLSLAETTATLGVFAENGIRGSMAGTALRGSITALLNPSAQVAEVLSSLGINAVDASGQLTSMQDIVEQLSASGATAGQIMQIFGERAGPAMVALVSQGSEALGDFTEMVESSQGVAQNLADAKMGGLTGAVEQLKGSLETLAITMGEAGLTGFMAGLAKGATGVANAMGNMPVPIQQAGLSIAGLALVSGPAIWAFGKLATLYQPVVAGMQRIVASLQAVQVQLALARMGGMTTGSALLAMYGPGAAIVVGIAALAGAFYLAKRAADEFNATHMASAEAADALAESAGIALEELGAAGDEASGAAVGVDDFRRANQDAIGTLKQLGNVAGQRAYLVEIGYTMVQRGADPGEVLSELQRLIDAAGVEIEVPLTVGDITAFNEQIDAAEERIKRVLDMTGEDKRGGTPDKAVRAELDAIAESAGRAWETDNLAGFIQMLGESEVALGENAGQINYLTDQALKELGEGFGFSVTGADNLLDALEQVAAGGTNATNSQEILAQSIIDSAAAMEGGLTPANLAAAAALQTGGVKASDYGDKVAAAGDAAGDAAGGVDDLTGELDDNQAAAEDAADALKGYIDSLTSSITGFFDLSSALRDNESAQFDLIAAQEDLRDLQAGMDPDAMADGLREIEDAARSVEDAYRSLEDATRGVEDAQIDLADINEDLAELEADMAGVTPGTKEHDEGLDKIKDQKRKQRDAVRGVDDAQRREQDAVRGVADAQRDAADAQRSLAEAKADAIPTTQELAEANQKVADAQQRVAETGLAVLSASILLKAGLDNGSISMETANLLLMQFVAQGLITSDTAKQLAADFGLTALQAGSVAGETQRAHGEISGLDGQRAQVVIGADATEFWKQVAGIEQWQQRYGFFRGSIGALLNAPNQTQNLQPPFQFGGGRAGGGPMEAGYSYTVGENGPETVHMFPSGGAHVDPGATVAPFTASMNDSRIVERLERLESSLATVGGVDNTTINVVERPNLRASDIVRAKRTENFLQGRR